MPGGWPPGGPQVRPGVLGPLLVLVSVIPGIISAALLDGLGGLTGSFQVSAQAGYVLPGLLAVAALLPPCRRWGLFGFLQGRTWPLGALAADLVVGAATEHIFASSPFQVANVLGLLSAALSAVAAAVLAWQWRTGVPRQSPGQPARPVFLTLTLALIAVISVVYYWLFAGAGVPVPASIYVLLIAEGIAGLGIGWAALRRQSRVQGAALVLGWAVQTILTFLPSVGQAGDGGTASEVNSILLVVLAVLMLIYAVGQQEPVRD